MAYAPSAIKAVYDKCDGYLPSLRQGGIVADKAGYHNSRNRLRSVLRWRFNYSVLAAIDKLGSGDAASGIDLTFDPVDMRKATQRLQDATDRRDPRLWGKIREWFGSLDGKRVVGYSLYRKRKATADKTHLWHVHISGHRKYADDAKVWLGIAEVLCGLPAGAFTSPPPAARPVPTNSPVTPGISVDLAGVQRSFREGRAATLALRQDVEQIQIALAWFTKTKVKKDGIPGRETRGMVAQAQAEISETRILPWPIKGHHPDADGIPGKQLLTKLGFEVVEVPKARRR